MIAVICPVIAICQAVGSTLYTLFSFNLYNTDTTVLILQATGSRS